jgi:hypothetical protein
MVSSSQIENAGYNRTSQYDFELYRPKGGVDCAFECRLVPLEEMNNLIQVIIGSMYHYSLSFRIYTYCKNSTSNVSWG